jgi:hypothetical protein
VVFSFVANCYILRHHFTNGRILPKVFFQIYANELSSSLPFPATLFYLLFWGGISWFCIQLSDFVLKTFFKSNGDEIQLTFSKLELGNYITEQMESSQEQHGG